MEKVKNPLKGSMLERTIQRAIYCVDSGSEDMTRWFIAQNHCTPQEYIDKWSKKLL